MVVNDDVGILNERGVLRFFAGKPAPTEKLPSRPVGRCAPAFDFDLTAPFSPRPNPAFRLFQSESL
jgi:hypothetical protein